MIPPDAGHGAERLAHALALLALALVALLMLYEAGHPIRTADAWWHLEMGEVFAAQGLWPDADPMLHTAPSGVPPQHEWLFDVALHGLATLVGLPGLRILHALTVAGIMVLVFSLFRREAGGLGAAAAATCVFVVLAWWRLWQLRPDLLSIPATLLLYRLLLEHGSAPTAGRIAGAVGLLWVWANAHALFLVGPLLLAAALAGFAARALLVGWATRRGAAVDDRAASAATGVAAALALGLLAAAANPRGIDQHLAFVVSSREGVIRSLTDEWAPFHPFNWEHQGPAASLAAGIASYALMGLFAVAILWGLARFLRSPSPARLRDVDPVLVALGAASIVAMLTAIRFFWMCVFPLLFLLRARRALLASQPAATPFFAWSDALLSCVLAASFVSVTGFRPADALRPEALEAYVRRPYDGDEYYEEGVRFLRDTGVAGNLFNAYHMGGFLGYWLAPRLRTFVDGRMNYPAEVLREYHAVNRGVGLRPGEELLDVLDRRQVDLFFGVGVPAGGAPEQFTTSHLENAEGWLLVSRSRRHAIYLRSNPRNRKNLSRVVAYYGLQGVPFDPRRGLDVEAVSRRKPGWARAHGLLPADFDALRAARGSDDPDRRFRALDELGRFFVLVGAYRSGVEVDRQAIALRPAAPRPRRRLVYALLRLGRADAGLAAARELEALGPDPRSARFLAAARAAVAADDGRAPIATLRSLDLLSP